ncbi:MAG: cardiolipin synthase [Christensenella sp.]
MKKFFSFFISRMFIVFALIAVQVWILVSIFVYFDDNSKLIQTIFFVTSVLMVLYIINKHQNPSYKLAWIVVILVVPVFGLLMYLFFSQRKLSKKMRRKAQVEYEKTVKLLGQDRRVTHELEQQNLDAMCQTEQIRRASMFPVYDKTQTEYLASGEAFFEQLKIELKKAKRYIFMEYFIVENGEMWNSVLEILRCKVQEGVDVRFMYDDMGCARTLPTGYYKRLREMGIKAVVFNPLRPEMSSIFNNRNHRKITVIDGHTAFCSGANLADEYINAIERFGHWKDGAVMLKGAGAWSFTMMCLQAWNFMMQEDADYSVFRPNADIMSAIESDGYVQPFTDDPMDDEYVSENTYMNMVGRAKRYLYINTPYLILDNEFMTALCNAAKSGVDVRITTPHIPDKKMVFLLTRAHYEELLAAGVKIYEYTPGFIHTKSFVCDDEFGIIGTINLDYRSLFLHYECGVWLYNTKSIGQLKEDYLKTLKVCGEVTYDEVHNRPWYVRLIQGILRAFAPMM